MVPDGLLTFRKWWDTISKRHNMMCVSIEPEKGYVRMLCCYITVEKKKNICDYCKVVKPVVPSPIKVSPHNFSHWSVFTGAGGYDCEQSSIKPFVVAEEAACILINWLWWWTVGFCTFVFSEVLCRGWSCCFSHTFNQLIISPLPHTHAAHLTPFI